MKMTVNESIDMVENIIDSLSYLSTQQRPVRLQEENLKRRENKEISSSPHMR
jgi:hypothetical protein